MNWKDRIRHGVETYEGIYLIAISKQNKTLKLLAAFIPCNHSSYPCIFPSATQASACMAFPSLPILIRYLGVSAKMRPNPEIRARWP